MYADGVLPDEDSQVTGHVFNAPPSDVIVFRNKNLQKYTSSDTNKMIKHAQTSVFMDDSI